MQEQPLRLCSINEAAARVWILSHLVPFCQV